MKVFPNGDGNLHAELLRLNVLIQREITRLRAAHLLAADDFRGLYLSDAHVDAILRQARSAQDITLPDLDSLTREAARIRADNDARADVELPLLRLTEVFQLDPFERDVLLLAAAPELELRYEVLCSYLNNDVTRKRPTCDLALRLFCTDPDERWHRRRHFAHDATLFASGLLQWLPESREMPASSLARAFFAPARVIDYLLGAESTEARLAHFTEQTHPAKSWEELLMPDRFITQLHGIASLLDQEPSSIVALEGAAGAGKRSCVEVLCSELAYNLIAVDSKGLMAAPGELAEMLMLLARESRLAHAGVYFFNAEALFDAEKHPSTETFRMRQALRAFGGPVLFGCSNPCDFQALFPGIYVHTVRLPALPFPLRRTIWRKELARILTQNEADHNLDVNQLANQFALTRGQIRGAVASAHIHARLRNKENGLPEREDLLEAARTQSTQQLRSLAQRIEPVYSWKDLVLPAATLAQLREVERALKYRYVVLGQWGFEQRLSLGKGLKALFAGASGTGKTMAAEVLSSELGVDLYKIDLANVVSKYIGETEKNLDKIFRAAQCSNAILFFDEADALFGKRSITRDAHDRYANIEVAYLLQKTEEYEGFVILATNLMQNMDEAFKRRLSYMVEFPFPDVPQREQLWRTIFPSETPLANELDFAFLARQFPLSGGNIKNAALAAAFLAAADEGGKIQMSHLIQGIAREWQKLGKLPSAADFKDYYSCIPHWEG